MAFALYLKTESSDDYVFAFDGTPTQKDIIKHVKENMGEEFDYVCSYKFDATYKIKFKIKTDFIN